MRAHVLAAIVLLTSCTASIPPSRRVFVAEGRHHVLATTSSTIPVSDVPGWYTTAMQTHVPMLRDTPGNVAVYVLRQDHDGQATMTILSEWKSREDLERCRRDGVCGMADEKEILFEALR
ncbi:MAG TPA: hypothetical protein VLV78_20515 [Thermoanaerobaculia bacterium]|nr:hypothetical protein [Thermoanaerobaculia bacterium]